MSSAATSPPDYSLVHPVPGLGKALAYEPRKGEDPLYIGTLFPSALSSGDLNQEGRAILPLTTLREFSMLQFMSAITDKENWHVKILDDEIANKWKTEGIEAARAALLKQWAKEDSRSSYARGHAQDLEASDGNGEDDSVGQDRESGDEGDDTNEEEEDDDIDQDLENAITTALERWPIYTARRDESALTETMADFCIAELRHKARSFQNSPNGAIVVYNGNVVKSDTAVSPETKTALQKAVEPLENVPDQQKDWHPGSDEQVLDLVHPSLFPLVYKKTKVLPVGAKVTSLEDCIKRCGEGAPVSVVDEAPEPWVRRSGASGATTPWSDKFQWLPCEVDVSADRANILSYINNLHPEKHRDLYRVIEDVITAAIPLWDLTLAPLADPDFKYHQRITYDCVHYDPDAEEILLEDGGPKEGDDLNENFDYWDLRQEWENRNKRIVLPDVDKPFDPKDFGQPAPFSLKGLMKDGRPLQVIVKLANIVLTPEKPSYGGGTWHVEGKLNEHIVATAIYYYSSSNITTSSLSFRQLSDTEAASQVCYPQNNHEWLTDIFGVYHDEGSVQRVGGVVTSEGRLLTFPNILQHKVEPFSLADRTKPGHRKILALFLVDPHIRVISTAHVPAQRIDWWRAELEKDQAPSPKSGKGLQKLPVELRDYVYKEVDGFPMGLAEAKALREELMEERKKFVIDNGELFENAVAFSLCEH
ncbi:hypothetical protein CC1G_05426 [Coprinopsis cinerea okayama7|uniref:Uncharacterized protein n=1 Tax=Coprinopsis cinerea (strain Okayama-7 / 130 / ATCC MYA-4618 / FGSC 9003) TaxID=240176 RepID=A8NQ25_COPC7|nr:hypothetical protein CC1G_05426 [Coprinopsis cinerea okayama7\|eukprot:XP_001835464.1 hypothetical protein CC1G_05426 [Coprinopsis cinerea okayama7\